MKSIYVIGITIVLGAAAIVGYCSCQTGSNDEPNVTPTPPIAEPVPTTPTAAELEEVVIPEDVTNQMVDYHGFTVGFNADAHNPNYVVWTLTAEHTDGPYNRDDVDFQEDPRVKGCAKLSDYKRSGYDRGHMAPAADMKWSHQSMIDCHYLTNMCPQINSVNAGPWASLETACRKWAKKFGYVIIVSGPVLSDKITRTIGDSKVLVPERFFKVVLAPEAETPMGIGFIMPNSAFDGGYGSTVVTIDQVESITGFDFYSALPDDIEAAVESDAKLHYWNY